MAKTDAEILKAGKDTAQIKKDREALERIDTEIRRLQPDRGFTQTATNSAAIEKLKADRLQLLRVAGADNAQVLAEQERRADQVSAADVAAAQNRDRIATGFKQGSATAEEMIGKFGELNASQGQIDTNLQRLDANQISDTGADNADILARRRAALEGIGGAEEGALRSKAMQEIGRNEEMQRRRMGAISAATGVRGGVAAAQQLGALQEGNQQRAGFERDLLLAQRGARMEALNALESSVAAKQQADFQRQTARVGIQQFNASQQLAEKELMRSNASNWLERCCGFSCAGC